MIPLVWGRWKESKMSSPTLTYIKEPNGMTLPDAKWRTLHDRIAAMLQDEYGAGPHDVIVDEILMVVEEICDD